jgi:hypothetical protein
MATPSYAPPESWGKYFVIGSSMLAMLPSLMAAPTSVELIDLTIDQETQRDFAVLPSS